MTKGLTDCRPTSNHDHDSGIGSFPPSSGIAVFDSAADQGSSEGKVFGDAEICRRLSNFIQS